MFLRVRLPRPLGMAAVLIILVVLFSGSIVSAQRLDPDVMDLLSQSVVQIITLSNGEPVSTGSGTIVDRTGVIYTNRHVVEGGDDYAIMILEDVDELPVLTYFATVTAAFNEADFAILQINRNANGGVILPSSINLPFVDPLAAAAKLDIARGDTIWILGYPTIGGGYLALTGGAISTVENGEVNGTRMPVNLTTDAEISPGNSGGLAVNSEGVPIGIPTRVFGEERTGGRLGGILPFGALLAMIESGTATTINLSQMQNQNQGQSQANPQQTEEPNQGQGQQTSIAPPVTITCDSGEVISNGASVTVVGMPRGFTYTATVLGLNNFDPILVVASPDRSSGLCQDDSSVPTSFAINLPGIGNVRANRGTPQIDFSQTGGDLGDIDLIVGGYEGSGGEFLLILEGVAVSSDDNAGDPFAVMLNSSLIDSGVPLSVYMIGAESSLDPLMRLIDADYNTLTDTDGLAIECDDAGDAELCWDQGIALNGARLTLSGGGFTADAYDSMLSINPQAAANAGFTYLNFLMTSYQRETQGRYNLVFHMGIAPG
ncbi:MAG: trypsin-like peptidase domain-containing protein [Anaerolineae bacterium]|nr:trypsin-like peptidase domain-containing protein [Anaerolineae bacterium]